MKSFRLLTACLLCLLSVAALAADPIPPIPRVLPPEGLEIPADIRAQLENRVAATKKRLEALTEAALKADIEIFTKAVELALLHREFYVERDFAKADAALDEANKRLDSLDKKDSPWTKSTGLVVRGYRSSIDSSAQPYGLVIPQDHDLSKPCPLYVWLHGRGDKNTDLHFIQERATRPGQITPPGAIVVHPFGRHCVGWKHAGEIDVLEAIDSVKSRYKIDDNRIVLIGFSMGGAGAWHIGAHYTDRFIAVSPGAGFAETARYQRLAPDRYPPEYEQKLWGLYDVPNYVRSLFNTQTIAYSGELDRQIQAARIMEEAFQSEGRALTHLIGPGVEHKYEPETLKELLRRLEAIVAKGRDSQASEAHFQTRTLRYRRQGWIEVGHVEEHWRDSRVDAKIVDSTQLVVTTKNISSVQFTPPGRTIRSVAIDDQNVKLRPDFLRESNAGAFRKVAGEWRHAGPEMAGSHFPLNKRWCMQGPIDDAFMSGFAVVLPTGKSRNPAFQSWMEFELEHLRDRWRSLMCAELPVLRDVDIDIKEWTPGRNLILWGDGDSNRVIRQLGPDFPISFANQKWSFGGADFNGDRYVPALIFPSTFPVGGGYIVLNSGLTFREGHDRTNSLQNPKLPDWAIIDITQPPDALSPGRIHDAGFFDEQWQLKSPPKSP